LRQNVLTFVAIGGIGFGISREAQVHYVFHRRLFGLRILQVAKILGGV
jgi:hypothetical protein